MIVNRAEFISGICPKPIFKNYFNHGRQNLYIYFQETHLGPHIDTIHYPHATRVSLIQELSRPRCTTSVVEQADHGMHTDMGEK